MVFYDIQFPLYVIEQKRRRDSGDANVSISLSGPAGKGTLYATAHKNHGEWKFDKAVTTLQNGHADIDLLETLPSAK